MREISSWGRLTTLTYVDISCYYYNNMVEKNGNESSGDKS